MDGLQVGTALMAGVIFVSTLGVLIYKAGWDAGRRNLIHGCPTCKKHWESDHLGFRL